MTDHKRHKKGCPIAACDCAHCAPQQVCTCKPTDRKLTPAEEWADCYVEEYGVADVIAAAQREAGLYWLSRAKSVSTTYRYNNKTKNYDIPACDCAANISAFITLLEE